MKNLFRTFLMILAVTVVLPIAGCTSRYTVIAYDNKGTILEGYAIPKGIGFRSPIQLSGDGLSCEGFSIETVKYRGMFSISCSDGRLIKGNWTQVGLAGIGKGTDQHGVPYVTEFSLLPADLLNVKSKARQFAAEYKEPSSNPPTQITQPSSSTSNVESPDNLKANLVTLKKTNACARCYLQGVNLERANLRGADLRGADLRYAKLFKADLYEANLQGVNFLEASLAGVNFQNADLTAAKLPRAVLWEANFQGAKLFMADLFGANLQRAHLENLNLEEVNLMRANLDGAYLQGAELLGAKLKGANFERAHLDSEGIAVARAYGALGLNPSGSDIANNPIPPKIVNNESFQPTQTKDITPQPVKALFTDQPRIALVIGNGAYQGISELKNPPNDARLMARTLRSLKFEVIEEIDIGQKNMKRAVSRFSKRLKTAGNNAVGLFYYAGHGVQVDGRNYLIPVDAKIETEADLDIEAVDANTVMRSMEYGNASLNFAILDACRNNPYARGFRSMSRGLARMEAPRGTLIAYATRPGDTAVDGDGANSPYTLALTKALQKPGLTVSDVFIEVRNEVMKQTDEQQVPWEEGGLTSRFYFAGQLQTVLPAQQMMSPDMLAWQSIVNSTNTEEIEAFILAFRNSRFAGMARARLNTLRKQQQVAVVVPPAPSPEPVQTVKKPVKTFKDCPECPEMVVVPSGSFQMGSNSGSDSEKPVHRVTLNHSFAVGKYEVTQGQWRAVMGNIPGKFSGNNYPVGNVSLGDVFIFINKLKEKTGKTYRLLSEAEWEYAARAGTTTKYSCGESENCLNNVSWYVDNSKYKPQPVGKKPPNAFGLHDMHGNVSEWTEDCWRSSFSGAPRNGDAWLNDGSCLWYIHRGGSWGNTAINLRSASRDRMYSSARIGTLGFRVARNL